MLACCIHNVLLVNQIRVSREKERFVCITSYLFQAHLCYVQLHVYLCVHETTQEKIKNEFYVVNSEIESCKNE